MSSNTTETSFYLKDFGTLIYYMGVIFSVIIGVNVLYLFAGGILSDIFYYAEIILRVIQFILLLMIIIKASQINNNILDEDVKKFVTFGIASFLIAITCYIWSLFIVIDVDLLNTILESADPEDPTTLLPFVEIVMPIVNNIIVTWVSYVFGFLSWRSMSKFIAKINPNNFIAISAVNKIKNGFLMLVMAIFVIPILVAPFLFVMGYLQFGSYLKNITEDSVDIVQNEYQPLDLTEDYEPDDDEIITDTNGNKKKIAVMGNFCSRCGSKYPTSNLRFCPNCGNKINTDYK